MAFLELKYMCVETRGVDTILDSSEPKEVREKSKERAYVNPVICIRMKNIVI